MKALLIVLLAIFFFGCQKEMSTPQEITAAGVVSTDVAAALAPLPCHSTAFVSNYPVVAGAVPPFRFSKTLYSDSRVKTINMLTRVYPIYSTYNKWAYEWIGTFTYGPNVAYFNGSRETWEYYKTPTGAGAKRSIQKFSDITLKFNFNARGFCTSVYENNVQLLGIEFIDPNFPNAVTNIYVNGPDGIVLFYPKNDAYGNPLSYDFPYNRWASSLTYTYDYTKPRGTKNYSFIPSQNLVSPLYSMCEVMQWVPQPTHQRKSVAGEFYPYSLPTYPYNTGQKVVQSQVYKNYVFDAKGNETSVTYADNVLQKTTWFCK